jgi:tetratricopeptide (TPR) repeat protein
LDISTENDQPISLAQALNNMANTYLKAGESERTLELCSRALDLFTLAGDHYGATLVRDTLAQAYHRRDRLDLAASYCRQAANGFLELGSPFRAAESQCTLDEVHAEARETGLARRTWHEALRLLEQAPQPNADPLCKKVNLTRP